MVKMSTDNSMPEQCYYCGSEDLIEGSHGTSEESSESNGEVHCENCGECL